MAHLHHSSHAHAETPLSTEVLRDWALEKCRTSGLRRTKALEAMLSVLAEKDRPMSLAQLEESPRLKTLCDRATIYRLLMRLEQHGVLRRLGLHDRAMYFGLHHPGRHSDYLVCTACGVIDRVELACPGEALEKEVTARTGYREVYHELEFFGVCPECSPAADSSSR